MYKIQIVDSNNQDVLIEENHEDLHAVTELFRSSQNPSVIDCFITDDKNRTRRGHFVTCTINEENNERIYKLHFKMSSEKIKA